MNMAIPLQVATLDCAIRVNEVIKGYNFSDLPLSNIVLHGPEVIQEGYCC